ncbi:class I SAM-dependent methyltransferase [Phenylobacterium sp.]|uniref:class I SAM-dependent methyltransferase n=1 Tax=Phenylobacterium sp. TaxID=1871053 RepID=UPI003BAC8882
MTQPDWWYDDLRQVGLDFEDEGQVATYDGRQGGDAAADRALLSGLGVTRDTALADIGCGTGILACAAAGMARSVRAIDVSGAMLRTAQARARDQGLSNIAFERGGFLTFPASGDLDLIVTKNALHHLPDMWKAVALTRMRDALKPGGRLYIRDVVFNCPPDAIPRTVESWIGWMTRETGYSREDVACHVREEHTTFGWILARMITEAGFRLVSRVHDGVYGTYVAEAIA